MNIDSPQLLTGVGFVLLDWIIRIVALLYIPKNRKPSSATAWLLAIFFIPFIGVLLFLVIGNFKLPKKRREAQNEMDKYIRGIAKDKDRQKFIASNKDAGRYAQVAILNEKLSGLPITTGNKVELLPDYNGSIARITKDINNAKKYVHIEYFIISGDSVTNDFLDSIDEAVNRGVVVRVLLDHMGSFGFPGYKECMKRLEKSGAEFELMLPVQPLKGKYQRPDLRNHRKLVVIDGNISYTGSQNIIDRSYLKKANLKKGLQWQELVVRMEGPVAMELNAVFATDWYSETKQFLSKASNPELDVVTKQPGNVMCQIMPSGPGFETENNQKIFASLLYEAKEKIVITSPYFVPDETMLTAVLTAAYRGLDVTLYVSEIGDQFMVFHAQRSYYEQLLRAGVKIRMYKAPYILHAKHLTVDDDAAIIGSSNMDVRSLVLDLEVCGIFYDKTVVKDLRKVEANYYKNSKELKLKDWMNRPKKQQFAESLTRLTSAIQ
jgi:cardiolipin synthase